MQRERDKKRIKKRDDLLHAIITSETESACIRDGKCACVSA